MGIGKKEKGGSWVERKDHRNTLRRAKWERSSVADGFQSLGFSECPHPRARVVVQLNPKAYV